MLVNNQQAERNRAKKIIALLSKHYPDAHCALQHKNAFELLIATILSAQCTDARVNLVTPILFNELPTPDAFVKAEISTIEKLIRSTGFYKNKAKNIKACSELLVRDYKGVVPKTMEELTKLPGVGRKTANVVLGNAYDVPGLVVDTHVTRLSNRLGFVKTKNAIVIEKELQKIIPTKDWIMFAHYLITHGRTVCKARKPDCKNCFLNKVCPKIL